METFTFLTQSRKGAKETKKKTLCTFAPLPLCVKFLPILVKTRWLEGWGLLNENGLRYNLVDVMFMADSKNSVFRQKPSFFSKRIDTNF